jgi:hypothetical protein
MRISINTLVFFLSLALNMASLIWTAGIPSTPDQGYRPWMSIVGIVLFTLGMLTFIMWIVLYVKKPNSQRVRRPQ